MRSTMIYFAAILGKLLKKVNPNERIFARIFITVLLVYVKSLI